MAIKYLRILFITFVSIMFMISTFLYSFVEAFSSDFETRGSILYVKPNGSGNCTSWSSACGLQTALYQANPGTQIWVASGTYKPSVPIDRNATFQLESGVEWYGGFPANGGNWVSRNWITNPTILSGDIGLVNDKTDNSFHVVMGNEVDETTIVDGFIIRDGNANGGYHNENGYGGGMYLYKCNPILKNLIFTYNFVENNGGGGLYNYVSDPRLTNVEFSYNTAYYTASSSGVGAGVFNYKSNPILNNVKFSNNSASSGGGMYNYESNPILKDVTFTSNYAFDSGGGMYNDLNSSPRLENAKFYYNSSGWGGGGGMENFNSSITLKDVIFYRNWTKGSGGALSGGEWNVLENVNFFHNSAGENCGAIRGFRGTLTDVIIDSNSAEEGYGGGMCLVSWYGSTLTNVGFYLNDANLDGGGLIIDYSYYVNHLLDHVIFYGNSARKGGGLANNANGTKLSDVTFTSNSANDSGGGMYNTNQVTLTNVTFSNNSAVSTGGGMYIESADNVEFINTTFFNNSALYGGGISNSESTPAITNSIIWGNTPDQVYNTFGSASITYSDVQFGYVGLGNLDMNPLLENLNYYGGFTPTHALKTGSPAIDAGDPNNCPPIDQRGYPRPFDGDNDGDAVCDMGAYEWQTASLTLDIIGGGDVSKSPNKSVYTAGEPVTLSAISNYDWIFSNWSGDLSGRKNPISFNIVGEMNITAHFVEVVSRIHLPIITK